MKANKIVYWVTTLIIGLMMLNSAFMYLNNDAVKQGFVHLGFPSYFRIELAALKIIGAVLLIAPLSRSFKEWAYAGFAITFVSAFIAHTASGDPLTNRIMPLVFLVLLLVLYITYHRQLINTIKQ